MSSGFDSRAEFPESPGERDLRQSEVEREIRSMPNVPEELKSELAKRSAMFIESTYEFGRDTKFRPPQIGWKHWVIRREQLDLLKHLSPLAAGIVAYAAVAGASVDVLIATTIIAVIGLVERLRTKNVTLDLEHQHVLLALSASGPSTAEVIALTLNGLRVDGGPGTFSESRVREILNDLKAIRARDTTLEPLVVQASDGLWSTNGAVW